MKPCPYPVDRLLPHAAPMILIDRVTGYDDGLVEAAVEIRSDSMFLDPENQGVPSYVGLEYMAQTCGAYAGIQALATGSAPRIGFLLGSRDYAAETPAFPIGASLIVRCSEMYRDDEMGSFDCTIGMAGRTAVSARVNLFQPRNAAAFLSGVRSTSAT